MGGCSGFRNSHFFVKVSFEAGLKSAFGENSNFSNSTKDGDFQLLKPMKEKLFQWLNLALTIDFFFVLLSFLWFAVAVVGRSTGVPLGLDLWHRLWEPVLQPAIGLLMAGALLSGLASWVNKQLNSRSRGEI